ncbi:3-deoxy-manno-octulosonate cytidylyltransferase [Aureimonas jatrophae]|uniref:3-deoxy-manno-octulosonate cytidylyltransferase n=1 Tax=Aureimonas jatrophae TaxID=1166073 RepID=A0A1H0NH34_9HYPH|nr:3-deoxy-manno-octulosonate cytidylyltransferase [Aureimonas jatrophae]MBB3951286.1 hypothetical protein [Aureimonas jatrophae]SDO91896.1 hypothetical protein SAMN05192530_12114 [Aureimonas jatrophae]
MTPQLPPYGLTGASQGDAWRELLSRYQRIVLVANSDAVAPAMLTPDDDTLFVFFNKVYKVLAEPFAGHTLLIARSSPAGANIVYRREVEDVVRLLRSDRFLGICNLRVGPAERFSEPAAFAVPEPVASLDLVDTMAGFYPATHVATSGFALAVFLDHLKLDARVQLAGFTAKRSLRWKLFADHDWTFEQIVLRLLLRNKRIEALGPVPDAMLGAIARRFPDIGGPQAVALAAAEVVAERLESANVAIEDLHRLTRPQRRLRETFERLKPKTRKARLAERDASPRR